jgi:hypothetical protein
MDDDLSVSVGVKAMAATFEFLAKLLEVVNLSVIDNADGLVLVEDRLVTTGKVDDAEPPYP